MQLNINLFMISSSNCVQITPSPHHTTKFLQYDISKFNSKYKEPRGRRSNFVYSSFVKMDASLTAVLETVCL